MKIRQSIIKIRACDDDYYDEGFIYLGIGSCSTIEPRQELRSVKHRRTTTDSRSVGFHIPGTR